jgi:hypothetical protein
VFGPAAARREPPCVRPARARCRARWHAATQARGACPAGADRGAHGATRPEGAWRTDLDVACPLLAPHRAGFVRPGRRRCLGQREPSSLSKVQSRSAGNRKAKGFQKSAIPDSRVGNVDKRARQAARRWRIARCEKTEAATEQPIAVPAWSSYGTRPPLRNLCDLRTVRAAGSGFRGRHRALCAGRGVLGRFFGLREAARPRTWRYAIAHCIRDKVHITNSWQSSRTCPCASL